MRVLFNAAFDTVAPVGIARYIACLVPPLSQLCDLTVASPDPDLFSEYCRTIVAPGMTRTNEGRVVWTVLNLPSLCRSGFDVVLNATHVSPLTTGVPVVSIVHDLTPLIMRRFITERDKVAFLVGLQTLRRASRVIAVSANTKFDLSFRYRIIAPDRVCVVHEGSALRVSSTSWDVARDLRPFALYVGGHALYKNLPRLVAAFARAGSARKRRLVIVGRGSPSQIAMTTAAIRMSGIEGRAVLLTNVSDEGLSSLYSHCDVFVYPSLYEGFGLPVVEAMTHGAPVACSRAGSLPEVAGSAASLFDPYRVRDIADSLDSILGDVNRARQLRMAGSQRAAGFSWERAAEGVHAALDAAVVPRSRKASRDETSAG